MALAVTTVWEIQSGGSDTLNGGAFDPGQTAGMLTDGAATVATSAAPVFTSAGYTFVADDVGAWLYIASGTNWTAGWYQIASVAAGAATLSAAVGAGVLLRNTGMTTVAGCATVASPTGATWTVDYSQSTAARFAYTDLASAGAGLTVSSAAQPFGKQMVGNCILVTGGTNFTTGRYVIASVAAGTFIATVLGVGNITTGAGASGTGGLGGAAASPGEIANLTMNGNYTFVKSGTIYSITSATPNVSGGCITVGTINTWQGYATRRYFGTPDVGATIQINVSTATIVGNGSGLFLNFIWDGNLQTASSLGGTNNRFAGCVIKNFNTTSSPNVLVGCLVTGLSASLAPSAVWFCEAYGNTATPVVLSQASGFILTYGNTGASTDGVHVSLFATNISAIANGRNGIVGQNNGTNSLYMNLVAQSNAAFGFKADATCTIVNYASYNNTSGRITGSHANDINPTSYGADAFANVAGNDYSLNALANAGAALRAKGYAGVVATFPRGLTTGALDIGAVQHADPVMALSARL